MCVWIWGPRNPRREKHKRDGNWRREGKGGKGKGQASNPCRHLEPMTLRTQDRVPNCPQDTSALLRHYSMKNSFASENRAVSSNVINAITVDAWSILNLSCEAFSGRPPFSRWLVDCFKSTGTARCVCVLWYLQSRYLLISCCTRNVQIFCKFAAK